MCSRHEGGGGGSGISKPHAINHQIGREHGNGATQFGNHQECERGEGCTGVPCILMDEKLYSQAGEYVGHFCLLQNKNRTQRQPKSGRTLVRVALLRGTRKGVELIICVEPSRRVERACRSVVSRKAENNSKPNAAPGKLQQRWQQGLINDSSQRRKGGKEVDQLAEVC